MEDSARSLGRYIRRRRDVVGISQTELGEHIGREQKYVSDLERGAVVYLPGPEVIRGLAEGLRCTPADLLVAAGYMDKSDPTTEMLDNDEIHEIRRAAEAVRGHLDTVIQRLAVLEADRATITNG